MEKTLIVDCEKCTGCRACELICSVTRTGEYNPKKASIKVLRHMEMDVSIPCIDTACDFCGKCVEWCFPEAIRFVDPEEAAIIRKQFRIGCFPSPIVAPGM